MDIVLFLIGLCYGAVIGYLKWAPDTPMKQGFITGMTFGLWRPKSNKEADKL